MATDLEFSKHFTQHNKELMKQGIAPFAPCGESVGAKKKFELHHIHFVANGGAVYDLDNLSIMTPKAHINFHSKRP